MRTFVSGVVAGLLAVGGIVEAQTYVEVALGAPAVTASTSDLNVPPNVIDNDLTTRWSGAGDGAWLQFDLGTTRTLGYVKTAVHQGDLRRNAFDLQVSTTTGAWTTILPG